MVLLECSRIFLYFIEWIWTVVVLAMFPDRLLKTVAMTNGDHTSACLLNANLGRSRCDFGVSFIGFSLSPTTNILNRLRARNLFHIDMHDSYLISVSFSFRWHGHPSASLSSHLQSSATFSSIALSQFRSPQMSKWSSFHGFLSGGYVNTHTYDDDDILYLFFVSRSNLFFVAN